MVRKPLRKERAPGDYGNIGQKGRMTGVVLEDTGVRDEHGIEPIPSFSSPQKLDAAEDGAEQDAYTATHTVDESMDMAQSPTMEQLEFIRSIRSARHRPIPKSKSPRKSNINGSPRQSIGLLSSPSKNVNNNSPSRSPLHQLPNRQLDFSGGSSLGNGVISPHRILLKPNGAGASSKKGKNKRPLDLTGLDNEDNSTLNDENADAFTNGMIYNEDPLPNVDDALGDFDPGTFSEHIEESIEQDDSYIEGEESALIDPEPFNDVVEETTPVSSKSREKPGKAAPTAHMVDPDASQTPVSVPPPEQRGKGGRSKQAKTEVYEDLDADVDSVAKPLKERGRAAGKKQKAPRERDPNARPKPASTSTSKENGVRGDSYGPRGRPYQVQRSETPATDNGAVTTRSGRTSYKPLAAWRGEKAIYGRRPDWETPASVTDIIRTDEIELPPLPRKKATRKARARSELEEIEEEVEEQPEDLDEWETQTGIMHAQVMRWDQEVGKYDETEAEDTEIAYASTAIQMRDIAGANFKFAKTLTLPFFGSGMVHLPPGGEKRVKNSRRMQMVFFVHEGRVSVDVGTPSTRFGIGRGGVWQVPRGNFYSITNESETKDARIFFAQGCEWAGGLVPANAAAGPVSTAGDDGGGDGDADATS